METLVFKKAEERVNSLKTFGSVASVVGVNGKIVPINASRALEQQACALKVELTKADGTFVVATCSKKVMQDLWNRELRLSELKTLDVIQTYAPKSELNPETNQYEKVVDENGAPVLEAILTLGYSGADNSAITLDVTEQDIAFSAAATRAVNWESLIAL